MKSPKKTPPKTRLNHPSEMYVGLALKNAQANEGMMPNNIEIIASSLNIRELSRLFGSSGGLMGHSVESRTTSRNLMLFSELGSLSLDIIEGVALPELQTLIILVLEPFLTMGLPSHAFPQ